MEPQTYREVYRKVVFHSKGSHILQENKNVVLSLFYSLFCCISFSFILSHLCEPSNSSTTSSRSGNYQCCRICYYRSHTEPSFRQSSHLRSSTVSSLLSTATAPPLRLRAVMTSVPVTSRVVVPLVLGGVSVTSLMRLSSGFVSTASAASTVAQRPPQRQQQRRPLLLLLLLIV